MISGARELMTPGAWERDGQTYRLREIHQSLTRRVRLPVAKGGHVATADGAAIFITDAIDPQLLQAFTTGAGHELVQEQLSQ